jgi:hypothetical protein
MANGTVDNFTIYSPEYHTAMIEALAKNLNLFNQGSAGAITLRAQDIIGDYESKTAFKLADTVDFRNTSSTSGQDDAYLEDAEHTAIKCNMKYKPVKMTLDAWRKKGMSGATFSAVLGAQNAVRKQQMLVTIATTALAAKISSVAALTNDITSDSTATLSTAALAGGLAKFGDAAGNIVAWVMHSKPYFDLVQNAITEKIYNEAGLVVYGGSPGTLGKPVVITDGGLVTDDSTPIYITLGLTAGAFDIVQSEPDVVWSAEVTGEENLAYRIQGEFAVNLAMRNCSWDLSNGGLNPDLTALGSAAYWDAVYSDAKLLPGVCTLSL